MSGVSDREELAAIAQQAWLSHWDHTTEGDPDYDEGRL